MNCDIYETMQWNKYTDYLAVLFCGCFVGRQAGHPTCEKKTAACAEIFPGEPDVTWINEISRSFEQKHESAYVSGERRPAVIDCKTCLRSALFTDSH